LLRCKPSFLDTTVSNSKYSVIEISTRNFGERRKEEKKGREEERERERDVSKLGG
jgi:hypothetical protein